jgi:hypothetical protein
VCVWGPHEIARQKLIAAKTGSKEYFDRRAQDITVKVDQVVLYDETVSGVRSKS